MPKEPPLRLHFLDGLRGLAGLYVLLFHEATPKIETAGALSVPLQYLHRFLDQGRHSVVFFIVLSGYSLMLPVARNGGHLVGGFRRYIFRRGRRILPPYYAALVASIALIVVYNVWSARSGAAPVDSALSPGSLLSHVLLVHNLKFDWTFRINGPMWSVATEWQIYFIFALLMLPLARRAGMLVTVILAWLLTSWSVFVLPDGVNLFWASPWFVGSFALGMYGAHLGFAPVEATTPRKDLPWGTLTWLVFAVVVAIAYFQPAWPYPLVDFPISVFAFCWINACLQLTRQTKTNVVLRALESRTLVYLGGFSYSVYLVQHPLLRLSEKAFNRFGLSHDANLLAHLFVVTPIVLAVAWVFSELVERPFTSGGILIPALKRRFVPASAPDAVV
jgi:peptidoglycan/LPS O-acetylase OafA/YrhL